MKPDARICSPWVFRGRHAPPRHWFFLRIFLLLFLSVLLALILTLVFSDAGFSLRRMAHFVGMTFLVLFASFFILRRMFGPLRQLMRGVHEISGGNLDFRFETGPHGEFRYLAETFNLMVQRIREMVQSKSQLLLDVSHELRSPLTRLKVALEMTPRSRIRDSMMQDISEMEAMLAEILETEHLRSRNGKLSLERLDLAALVRDFIPKYKGRKPGVKLAGKPRSLWVDADESRLRTVLQNVLENALKYSSHQKKPVQLSLGEQDAHEFVAIQDFGVGIPEDEQERIFEPFYRVDKSRSKQTGGYGLGLSLAREIMQAHGGEIVLQSKPGKGTKVTLKFPK